MLKPRYSFALAAVLLSGCAMTEKAQQGPVPVDADTLAAELASSNQVVLNKLASNNAKQTQSIDALTQTLATLSTKVGLIEHHTNSAKVVEVPAQCPETLGDKFLLGQVEYIYVEELKAAFNTRIDTGAESSSIDARNIILFERDGQQWVRFDVHTQGMDAPAKTFESKVERFVRIKQDALGDDDRRPVIRAHLKIGQYQAQTDLNLTDRSHLEYPLLLGRKFMKDIAVVDVSKSYIHGKPQAATNKDQ